MAIKTDGCLCPDCLTGHLQSTPVTGNPQTKTKTLRRSFAILPRMNPTPGPGRELDISVDLDALRARLQDITDRELVEFGKEMHALVFPLTYGSDGRPTISAFSIQLDEARAEWRRRVAKSSR
jgi:hypothetical protein